MRRAIALGTLVVGLVVCQPGPWGEGEPLAAVAGIAALSMLLYEPRPGAGVLALLLATSAQLLWIPLDAARAVGPVSPLQAWGAWAFLSLYSCSFLVAAVLITRLLMTRTGGSCLWLAPLWFLAEVARSLGPHGFDFLPLGLSGASTPLILGGYGFVGLHGTSLIIVALGGVLARSIIRRRWWCFAALACVLSSLRLLPFPGQAEHEAAIAEVSIVQATSEQLAWTRMVRERGRPGSTVVLAPEGVLMDLSGSPLRGFDVIAGVRHPCASRRNCTEHNAVVHHPGSGGAWRRYVKELRVPWYETPSVGMGARGSGTPRFDVEGVGFGVLICYEIFDARFVRRAASGTSVLLLASSDDWSRSPWLARVQWSLLRAYAAEHGIAGVRASSRFLSGLVSPSGEVLATTGLQDGWYGLPRVLSARAPVPRPTLRSRFPDLELLTATLVAVAVLLCIPLRRIGCLRGPSSTRSSGSGGRDEH